MSFFSSKSVIKPVIPKKLSAGDEVRVFASSRSLGLISKDNVDLAIRCLEQWGLKVSFAEHASEIDLLQSSLIDSRMSDFHQAFSDKNVKGIFNVIAGFNANQLLTRIDYDLIKNNPKVVCGFSDFTAIQNAIFAKTGLVTYSGPNFSSLAMQRGFDYTADYIREALFSSHAIQVRPSKQWSDDDWFRDQENRDFLTNEGYWLMQPGKATGTIMGGNLSALQLLQGTEFMPPFRGVILFLEECALLEDHNEDAFERNLQSLLYFVKPGDIQGLVIGRFERKFGSNRQKLKYILDSKPQLKGIPIIANVDFGHTNPMFTFPIGGNCILDANADKVQLTVQ